MADFIRYTIEDKVAVLVIDHPPVNAMNEETFWVVRKPTLVSKVDKHPGNPIKTSYELLWAEVRKPERSNLAIQNTLRRILENYFKIL